MTSLIKRRDFLLGGTAALATTAAFAQSITPQLGGGIGQGFDGGLGGVVVPAPPTGQGYVYWTDGSGNNQVLNFTDTNGVTRPLTAAGGS